MLPRRQTASTRHRKDRTMSTTKPVVVYGASGYTGRLICEYLREYNVPFVAAGRDRERLQGAMDRNVPGIETADYEVAAVGHSVDALTKLFTGAKVVRSEEHTSELQS